MCPTCVTRLHIKDCPGSANLGIFLLIEVLLQLGSDMASVVSHVMPITYTFILRTEPPRKQSLMLTVIGAFGFDLFIPS